MQMRNREQGESGARLNERQGRGAEDVDKFRREIAQSRNWVPENLPTTSARNCSRGSGRAGRFEGTGARLVARAKILGNIKRKGKENWPDGQCPG